MVDLVFREAVIFAVHANYDSILDFKSTGKTVASNVEEIVSNLPCLKAEYSKDGWRILPSAHSEEFAEYKPEEEE